jgi:hypothetical protein
VKVVTSLLATNILISVLIRSCGLVKDRNLYRGEKRCVEHVANMRERCIQGLMRTTERKGLHVRPSRRWEDNNKMVLQGMGWGRGLNLSASGQGQVLCACECDEGNSRYVKC